MDDVSQADEGAVTRFSISKFAIKDLPANSIVVRLSKARAHEPFFSSVELNRNPHIIIEGNRFSAQASTEPVAETPSTNPAEVDVSSKPASGFSSSFSDFISGAFQFVSGSEMLRMEMELTIAAIFHTTAEQYLIEHGARIGKHREKYAWYVVSDKKIGDFRSQLDRRMEKGNFIRGLSAMLIPALVSHFDAFILRTVNDLLKAKPDIANSINKTISVQELLEFSSIEHARAAIVDKEIDSLMRDSHEKHLKWIAEKSGVKIEPDEDLRRQFFELCERRNILIHNDGKVNSVYIEKCAKYGIDTSEFVEGQKLETGAEYLSKSISCIFEMATKISQAVWRSVCPEEISSADKALNDFTYDLIQRKKYQLAIRLFQFCRGNIKKWSSETVRLQNLVNHANALRLSGKRLKAKEILDAEDWEARSPDFQICAAAVREDYKKCIDLLKLHRKSIGIDRINFVEWPVFIGLRDDADFQAAFMRVFGESLIDDMIKESKVGATVLKS